MSKSKIAVQSIQLLARFIKPETFLPVYFFFGDDSYSIDSAVKLLDDNISPLLSSELDKEVITGKEKNIVELIDMASSYPFGDGKKLLIVKDFDEVKGDKKKLVHYVQSPNPSTILIMTKHGNISNLEAEPYLSLSRSNYIFEAREPKGEELINWVVKYAARRGKKITSENASLLVTIAGENRSLIEMQLQKILSFMGGENTAEITGEVVNSISSNLKELTIFDLQNAIAQRNRVKAYEAAANLLEQGKEALFIISMLTRFFTIVAQVPELEKSLPSERDVAQKLGIYYKYFDSYKNASRYFRDTRLFRVAGALFNADLSIKTSASDPSTVITVLLAEILA